METESYHLAIVEALLIASELPVTQERIDDTIGEEFRINLPELVEKLNQIYTESRRSFFIMEVAGGYQIVTRKSYEELVRRYLNRSGRMRLSNAALEALAIIAYRQPIARPDIDQIRGVNSDGVLSTLLEKELIMVAGRADSPGRPLLYKTSQEFLRYFGLNSTADLPRLKELEEMLAQKPQTIQEAEKENASE
ncbi:MAG TPA: SMC-Scp complex subunit ScpB [Candidatus Marinimicrobia bacterium]|nr:SMC-Scp complex subunit ScpB [Candidatus Neomarinimicrobiota bacterium]